MCHLFFSLEKPPPYFSSHQFPVSLGPIQNPSILINTAKEVRDHVPNWSIRHVLVCVVACLS